MERNEVPGSTIEEIKLRKEEVNEINEAIEFHKEVVEFSEAIKRLKQNPDYIKVYEQGYFAGESERISKVLVEPNPLKRDQIENMVEMLSAIRYVKTFLMHKENDGVASLAHIEDLEKNRSELLNPTE